MSNSDEFYIIQCILNYSYVKDIPVRYLTFEGKIPTVTYKEDSDFLTRLSRYNTSEEAVKAITDALSLETDASWSIHDRISYTRVRNNNKYSVVKCRIEGDQLIEISSSNIAELDRHW